jgi:hypothetical protein
MGVWVVLHLQMALNQPSQPHPFSHTFCSFYVMIPIEQRRLKTTMTVAPNTAVSMALPLAITLLSLSLAVFLFHSPFPINRESSIC